MKQCIECKRPMRSSRQRLQDFPGTVAHNSKGMCMGCHSREYRQKKKAAVTAPDLTATIDSLTAYLEWRRPYRAKVGAE